MQYLLHRILSLNLIHRRYYLVAAVLAIFFFLNSSYVSYSYYGDTSDDEEKPIVQQIGMSLSQTYIYVTNDSDLDSQTGGTYIIEDLVITEAGPEGHGIHIKNTTHPFIIRNCAVSGIDSGSGILFYKVSNASLDNVECEENSGAGISILASQNISIINSVCSENVDGIELVDETTNITIRNSTCEFNSEYGVYVGTFVTENIIKNCTFVENYIDVKDDDGSKTNFFNLNFYSSYEGVDINPEDMIGDSPHEIIGAAGNEDIQPVMIPRDRDPVKWTHTPPDPYIMEYGDSLYFEMGAIIYGGLGGWTINNSDFSISTEGVLTEAVWLPVDEYNLNVTVSNNYEFTISHSFTVEVEDTITPEWEEIPTDQYVELGDFFIFDIFAYDLSIPLLYAISDNENFTINPSNGFITNGTTFTAVYNYTLEVAVRDFQNNWNNETITIYAVDTTPPHWIENPTDQTLEYDTPFAYDVNATDYSGVSDFGLYNLTYFNITATGIITNVTLLPVGDYLLEIWTNDTLGNILNHTITIHVIDTTPPIWISGPSNQIIEYGNVLDVTFEAWDPSGISFWTVNDTSNFDATSIGKIFNRVDLERTIYSLRVTCYDTYMNGISADITITVQDTKSPVWVVFPSNNTIELGVHVDIALQASDPSGLDVWWIESESPFSVDSTGLVTNTTPLEVDEYAVTIKVNDTLGHELSGFFTIEVVDTTPPTWYTQQSEFIIEYPDAVDIELDVRDLSDIADWSTNNTAFFTITTDGRLQSSVTLSPDRYIVEITATDDYGNSASIVMIIHIINKLVGFYIIAGVAGFGFILGFIIIVKLFSPKRGRFGFEKGGAT